MSTATATIVLDKRKKSTDNARSYYVKVRVTANRSSKFYPCQHKKDAQDGSVIPDTLQLNRTFTEQEFERIMTAARRTEQERLYKQAFDQFQLRAETAINKTPVFTFEAFERAYIKNASIGESVKAAYDDRIATMKKAGQIGNATNYQCAINSLESFKSGLRFSDVTTEFLKRYDQHMRDAEKSPTTISMYLRTLRTIFNEMIYAGMIDKAAYPFKAGKGDKNKYAPPSARNVKKALKPDQLAALYHYQSDDPGRQKARDFFAFSYLANGMNMKDILNLKHHDVEGEYINYERIKTQNTKETTEKIVVHIKDEMRDIIKKYSTPTLDRNAYLFPVLTKKMNAQEQYNQVQNFTHYINKKLKKVCEELEIPEVTTYWARHSFSTTLKKNGTSVEFISEALGHSSIAVTKNYLDSFEDDAIKQATDILIPKQKAG